MHASTNGAFYSSPNLGRLHAAAEAADRFDLPQGAWWRKQQCHLPNSWVMRMPRVHRQKKHINARTRRANPSTDIACAFGQWNTAPFVLFDYAHCCG